MVEHYKARLLAQGYSQRPGINYEETLTLAAQEAIWLNRLLVELQSQKEPSKSVTIFEDNQSAICMGKTRNFMDEANI